MIDASYKNNFDGYVKFAKFHSRKAKLVSTIIWSLCFLCFAVLFVLFAIYNAESRAITIIIAVALLAFSVSLPFVNEWLTISRIKKSITKNPNLVKTTNRYVFDEDKMHLEISNGKQKEQYDFKYPMFYSIYESEDCFYLYLNSASAFILEKKGITVGTVDELKELLKGKIIAKKYFELKEKVK